MRYLSLFSGIGGFEVGINEAYAHQVLVRDASTKGDGGPDAPIAGAPSAVSGSRPERDSGGSFEPGDAGAFLVRRPECIGFSEIDRHASSVYKHDYPNHNELGDITRIDAAALPDFDLLVGGFPCQAFSVAGKRLGFDDTRGTLFFEIARILAVKKPRNFVLENVRGLLSHDSGRTFRTILSALNDLGYGVEWQVLNSKDFGVPQNRERVYIVGHLGGLPGRKVFPIVGADAKGYAPSGERFPVVRKGREFHERVISNTLDANYYKGLDAHQARTGVAVLQDVRGLDKKQNGKGWKEDGPSYTVDTLATQGVADGYRIRRLTPTECERLQAFPDGWTATYHDGKPVSDTQRYKMLGNAVTTSVVEAVVENLLASIADGAKMYGTDNQ